MVKNTEDILAILAIVLSLDFWNWVGIYFALVVSITDLFDDNFLLEGIMLG